jgi:Cu+-exporting ATPase
MSIPLSFIWAQELEHDKRFTFVKASLNISSGAQQKLIGMMKDPICGMMVDEKTSKLKSEHEGRTFYFCSQSCKTKFDADPHRYGHPKGVD